MDVPNLAKHVLDVAHRIEELAMTLSLDSEEEGLNWQLRATHRKRF